MGWSLVLLVVMGQCPFLMCHFYEYHFIDKKMNWTGAQTYCRKHYTDLATVYDTTDMRRLINSTLKRKVAWIGLYNDLEVVNRTWHWSLPGVEYNDTDALWRAGEPDNFRYPENCVGIRLNAMIDLSCDVDRQFYCYETQRDNFILIADKMTWLRAQSYCRENHTDLISGHKEIRQVIEKNTDEVQGAKPDHEIFVGLFADSWKWSDGNTSSFRYWHLEFEERKNKSCAMIMPNKTGKWGSGDCATANPFFCYEDKVILIKENKTWEEALNYCRDFYNDLVSITSHEEQRWVQEKAKSASTPHVWLGLRYTCMLGFWFWVSDEAVTFVNWAPAGGDDCDLSGAMGKGEEYKWSKHSDEKEYNFICSRF